MFARHRTTVFAASTFSPTFAQSLRWPTSSTCNESQRSSRRCGEKN